MLLCNQKLFEIKVEEKILEGYLEDLRGLTQERWRRQRESNPSFGLERAVC